MITVVGKVEWNIPKTLLRCDKAVKYAQTILDSQIIKDTNEYVPKDTGRLTLSPRRNRSVGTGLITYAGPYARRLYYGVDFNFQITHHAKAGALWFKRSKEPNLRKWKSITQDALKEGLKKNG